MERMDIFTKHFVEYRDYYIIIGGTACGFIFESYGEQFRATKDIDIVLVVELLDKEFALGMWEFISNGEYEHKYVNTNKSCYRFDKPKNGGYPKQIELFTRKLTDFELRPGAHLLPLHVSDEVSSLSAILLDDDYYYFLLGGVKIINGLQFSDESRIIAFKAKAWREIEYRMENGLHGSKDEMNKHKNDILKLARVLDRNMQITLPQKIKEDLEYFIDKISGLAEVDSIIVDVLRHYFNLR